jgi:hypothetical protein
MNTVSSLTGVHLRTYNALLQHPVSHNLGWLDVHALFRHLGEVQEQPNGNLKATRNGHSLMLHPSRTKEVATTEELMALRHFLARSETPRSKTTADGPHLLLVIDHQEALIFHTEIAGGMPLRLKPHSPTGHFRSARGSKDSSHGQDSSDLNAFFEPVALALQEAGQILVFGNGTGAGSEMAQFVVWMEIKHPATARRIIGAEVVDESHLTEGQLLAKARESYANIGREKKERGNHRSKIVPEFN